MTERILKFMLVPALCLSFVIGSVTTVCAKKIDVGEFETITKESTEKASEVETEPSVTKDDNFFPTDIETPDVEEEKTTEEKTHKNPHNTTTTKRPQKPNKEQESHKVDQDNHNNNQNNYNPQPVQKPNNQVNNTEEESTLPEGSFYVYLERNNGSRKLKRVIKEKSLVPEPPEPTRKGYLFDGWYKDEKFLEPWNFYTDLAQKEMTLYAKWTADKSTVEYKITIKKDIVGGKIKVNPSKATQGEPVVITVIPEEGNRLKQGSVTINGKKSDVLSFLMPEKDVVIGADFEKIPQVDEKEEKSVAPFIIIAIIILAVIGVVIFIIFKRRKDLENLNVDENGTVIDDEDSSEWVDKSIVIEDGFKNGEKHKGIEKPDYGAPDAPDEEDWFK